MKRLFGTIFVLFAAVAHASGGAANGDCLTLLCSSKKVTQFEIEVKAVRARHPGNAAVNDLAVQLGAAISPNAKNAVVVKFFALKGAMDSNDLEKTMESRLNDGQSDKVSNADVQRLTDVFVGTAE